MSVSNDSFKVSLGVNGDDGIFLLKDSSETCYFQVEFDMLIGFDCTEFFNYLIESKKTILSSLSGFSVNATIESYENNLSNSLQTNNVFNFNINNKPTGVYFFGQESICNSIYNQILKELGNNCDVVTDETFATKWVNFKFKLNDNLIGKKIKLGFQFINPIPNFKFLLDNIKINKICVVNNEDILNITNQIGFDLTKTIDNKKSWTYTETESDRVVDYLDYRNTNYKEKDSRLLINSKEVDLTLNPSKVIENDLFCYSVKNDCFFNISGNTDLFLYRFKDEIDGIKNVESFKEFVLTRLIDPTSRQVIRDYPLLRYLFDKYLNLCGLNQCENLGNQYNYDSLQTFINLVGDYWIDLIEQLVPSSVIWKGATRLYRNTIFDQPKYKYKNYSLLVDCKSDCNEYVITGITECTLNYGVDLLKVLAKNVESNKNQALILKKIVSCWLTEYSTGFGEGGGLLSSSIRNCINSQNNSIDTFNFNIKGTINGTTIFDEMVISGTSLNDLSGITSNGMINAIINGFSGNGYTVTETIEGFNVISPSNDDCGKTMNLSYNYDFNLSCISGGTPSTIYPNKIDTTLDLDSSPTDLEISSGNKLYIADMSNNRLVVINCVTNTILTSISISSSVRRLTYNSNNDSIYLLSRDITNTQISYLTIIDCPTNTISDTITLPFDVNFSDIKWNSINNSVYISDYNHNRIWIFDCTSNQIIQTITDQSIINPKFIEFNSINNKIYCTMGNNQLLVLDCSNPNNTIISLPISGLNGVINDLRYDSTNNKLYVINSVGDLYVINCSTGIKESQINYSYNIFSLEYCPTYNVLYLLLSSNEMKIIDMSNLNALDVITNINQLNDSRIIYNSIENKVYVTSNMNYEMTILDTPVVDVVVTKNCEFGGPLINKDFEEIYTEERQILFDCTKCVGLENEAIEVIIEPINIFNVSGNTVSKCLVVDNSTRCSEVYIKNINNDVIFSGKII